MNVWDFLMYSIYINGLHCDRVYYSAVGKHVHLDNVRYTRFRLHVQTVTQINSHVYNIGKLSHSIM